MSKILALAALVCVPVAGALGYVAHKDPAPPPFGEYLLSEQNVRHVPGIDEDTWIAEAVTGPNKGGSMDVIQALSFYRTHDDLEASARGKVIYVERKCSYYTTSGKQDVQVADRVFIQRCDQATKSRKQAEEYFKSLLAPPAKS